MRRLGWAALVLGLLLPGCSPDPVRPSVVLVTLDTTRVDHLTPYGYDRPITPNLEALARKAVRFSRAWSPSPWTLPAHASLFTGLRPEAHGARSIPSSTLNIHAAVPVGRAGAGQRTGVGRLEEHHRTLAELLAEAGYRTAAFAGGPWLEPPFGLMQGFDHADADVPDVDGRPADELTDGALAWLKGVPPEQPFFLFVNYFDAHMPYEPPPGFDDLGRARESIDPRPLLRGLLTGRETIPPDQRQALIDAYDAEIRFADHELGRLLQGVESRPGGGRTLIVVTADHGEAFGEGGRWGHTYWLSEELLRVPLLVRYPGGRGAGSVREEMVQLMDILPLVAAEVELSLPEGVQGAVPGARRMATARLYRHQLALRISRERFDRELEAAIEWPFKLVRSDRGARDLFRIDRLRDDPADAPEVAARLATALDAGPPEATPVPARGVDDDTRRALRELGYLE